MRLGPALKATKPVRFMTSLDGALGDLSHWIASHWQSGFNHSYSIADSKSPVWLKWRSEIHPKSPGVWWCNSIEQAAKHYSWTTTNPSFEELSDALQTAIQSSDVDACADICLAIFRWGGVARVRNDRSCMWVIKHQGTGELCSRINRAIALLRPDSSQSLEEFNGVDLLMNSALTKIYAAADLQRSVVIYDGRVGAALGLIARRMLEQMSITAIPQDLRFAWGPPSTPSAARLKTRDPSYGSLTFKKLPNSSQSKTADLRRAELSRVTNILCRNVVQILNSQGIHLQPIDLEKALFMIGFDVRTSNSKV